MGLGKTLEMLALVLKNPYDVQLSSERLKDQRSMMNMEYYECRARLRLIKSRATLVIVPPQLLSQWRSEVIKCIGDALLVRVWDAKRTQGRYGWGGEECLVHLKITGNQQLGLSLTAYSSRLFVKALKPGSAAANHDRKPPGDLYDCIRVNDEIEEIYLVESNGVGKWTKTTRFIQMVQEREPSVPVKRLEERLEGLAASPHGLKLRSSRDLKSAEEFADSVSEHRTYTLHLRLQEPYDSLACAARCRIL